MSLFYDGVAKYGIKNGDLYERADGFKNHIVKVIDATTYADVDDVVVIDLYRETMLPMSGEIRRIDAFKLHMVRYSKIES